MMLTCTLLLMVLGAVLVMAASPPVAERIGLAEHHFVFRQIFFMLPALLVMLVTSILTERTIRILCLLGGMVITGLMMADARRFAPATF